jgi:hypothetical protein
MVKRWLPVGVLAVVLFAVNVVSRLIVRLGYDGSESAQGVASMVMFGTIAVIMAAVTFVVARRRPVGRWLPDLAAAGGAALLLTIFVGPFISGDAPFSGGAGNFFEQVWLYAAFAGGGALIGFLVVTALGLDYRSQSLKRYAQQKLARPRRAVRR